ncbi:MAG: AAA family ATPase [Nitrospirae bacterium]|nr:AAA family ATPase [Nitrospirota bacterium]
MDEFLHKLQSINLRGFKSIGPEGQLIEFGDITVLIGANGVGKSNFVSFFNMLDSMMTGRLQSYVGRNGFASSLLHYGGIKTDKIQAEITFSGEQDEKLVEKVRAGEAIPMQYIGSVAMPNKVARYRFQLVHASGDVLIFTDERFGYDNLDTFLNILGSGHKESILKDKAKGGDDICRFIYDLLSGCRVFQFNDTSSTARIRGKGYISDVGYLHQDAGNLAAFLYTMANNPETTKYYTRIVRHIQAIFPQFRDFRLEPSELNEKYIELNWLEKDSDYIFGPHQLSDGTLRFMALTTLFLQPPKWLPKMIIVDEPELGLHPSAIADLASMVKQASYKAQIILATQSPRLVDEFDPEQIVVVERDYFKRQSIFIKQDADMLDDWLERYSLSELWEKNVLGGKPYGYIGDDVGKDTEKDVLGGKP